MSDLISREAAIKVIDDLPNCPNGYSDTYDKSCIIGVLEEMLTVDAVEVVRCKDCRWWDAKEDGYMGYCHAAKHGYYSRNWEIEIYRLYGPYFFCADGEVRGGEE